MVLTPPPPTFETSTNSSLANQILNGTQLMRELIETFNDALNGNGPILDPCGPECQDSLFSTVSVVDLLYRGQEFGALKALKYALGKVDICSDLNIGLTGHPLCRFLLGLFGPEVDLSDMPTSFSFFGASNGSKADQIWEVDNGRYRPDRMIQILKWNGMDTLPEEW